ncbi:hypothetical protein MUN88_18770 [Gracilibacillus caseinilyticus]|uniref:Uncharacterized protein n=1 Tax=Gracilibacillus caseinilyticus TaxID=2932256 RepID=A0ABY4EV21_9BACI|nr:hypothetical protein [Gracilibacillus caseinilyticus]UOQ48073.1 hypothetical protein MUN88_18770 [Gracilibacillus caseinilyticus]
MGMIRESMALPVDNFLGMLIYAVIYMAVAGLISGLSLTFIPNRFPYAVKSLIVFIAIVISLLIWWQVILSPALEI